jgi:hypothetical protein
MLGWGWGVPQYATGFGLRARGDEAKFHDDTKILMTHLDNLEKEGKWQAGDVLLYRGGFPEADLLPDLPPGESRRHVEGALAAPLTTLYVGKSRRSFVILSESNRRGDKGKTWDGPDIFDPARFYSSELAEKLRGYSRYWICTHYIDWSRQRYLNCLIPWLANSQGWDLKVARTRQGERYFQVPSGSSPDEKLAGLSNSLPSDFTYLVLVRRILPPGGGFTVGALAASMMPNAHVTVPTWLATQYPTPHAAE